MRRRFSATDALSPTAALVVRAVDQPPAHAHLAHLANCYFLRAVHHSTSLARFMAGDFGFLTLTQSLQGPAL
jgi:hypothetical protein